jgi:L-ribulose-5-phosphate 4-epimerase
MNCSEMKQEVVRIAKKADDIGLCRYKSGNFSIIDRKSGLIYITPSCISRDELTEDKIAIVDLEGNAIEAPYRPSIETSIHAGVYKFRKEAGGVAHSHSRYASIFACMGKEILPVSIEAVHYEGVPVKVADYGAPGSSKLVDNIQAVLKDSSVCLLKYHGVLAAGETLEKALLKLIYIEEVAFLYYHLINVGHKEFMPQSHFNTLNTV